MDEQAKKAVKDLEDIVEKFKEVKKEMESYVEELKRKCNKEIEDMTEKTKKLEIQLQGKMLYLDKVIQEKIDEPKNCHPSHQNHIQNGCRCNTEFCLAHQSNDSCAGQNNYNPGWVRGSRARPYYRPYQPRYQRY